MKYFIVIFIVLFLYTSSLFAQWEYWEANDLPTATTDTAWHFEQEADQEITYSTIIDDPDIIGNKLLQFSEPDGPAHESFLNNWNADPSTGATLVFRMKALEVGTYNRDWDIYLYNGAVRERLISNNGAEIKFDKSKAAVAFDTQDWHIYRLTIIEDQIELYIDEDVLSYITTTGETNEGNLFRFGDLGSSTIGTLYDWIAWDVSGAYPPEEGYPFPEVLTGLPTAIEKTSELIPSKLELKQNYPNPFNPSTTIDFNLHKKDWVKLSVYNLLGEEVRILVNNEIPAGTYSYTLNMNNLPSGIYFYVLKAGNLKKTKKMMLVR